MVIISKIERTHLFELDKSVIQIKYQQDQKIAFLFSWLTSEYRLSVFVCKKEIQM